MDATRVTPFPATGERPPAVPEAARASPLAPAHPAVPPPVRPAARPAARPAVHPPVRPAVPPPAHPPVRPAVLPGVRPALLPSLTAAAVPLVDGTSALAAEGPVTPSFTAAPPAARTGGRIVAVPHVPLPVVTLPVVTVPPLAVPSISALAAGPVAPAVALGSGTLAVVPTPVLPHTVRWTVLLRRAAVTAALVTVVVFAARKLQASGTGLDALTSPDWPWVLVAAGCAGSTYVSAAIGLRAASARHLPLGRTVGAQLAAAVANRLTPAGLGGIAVNVRYLERSGLSRGPAGATVATAKLSGAVVRVCWFLLACPSALPHLAVGSVGILDPVVLAGAGAGLLAVVLFVRRSRTLRARGAAMLAECRAQFALVRARPSAVATLAAAAVTGSAGHIAAFTAIVMAFGAHVPLAVPAMVYLTASAAGSTVPTPGGLGGVDVAMVAGLAAAGLDPGTAVAVVVADRMISWWLPVVPGLGALLTLRRRGAL